METHGDLQSIISQQYADQELTLLFVLDFIFITLSLSVHTLAPW